MKPTPPSRPVLATASLVLLLAGCASVPAPSATQPPAPVESIPVPATPQAPPLEPFRPGRAVPPLPAPRPKPTAQLEGEVRARAIALLPPTLVRERDVWAGDIAHAFVGLELAPSDENLCAAIAVIEQESGFQSDPVVPGLSRIAWKEIETRRQRYAIPQLALDAALATRSGDGRSYRQRIDALRTERQLSELYGEIIDELPAGKRLLGGYNPVRTGGPMQVSIAYAELHVKARPYPALVKGSVRDTIFTRRGGLYFGIAHLLDYPAGYRAPLYRFADFNAGHYASRNAAFQQAVARLSGRKLAPDGDLLRYEDGAPSSVASSTQQAVQALARRLNLGANEINAGLALEKQEAFARSAVYRRVFALADEAAGRPVAREALPDIALKSPKITRKLTTAWFAERVNTRHGACMTRATAAPRLGA